MPETARLRLREALQDGTRRFRVGIPQAVECLGIGDPGGIKPVEVGISHRVRGRGEHEDRIQPLRQFLGAAVAVAELARDPARVREPAADQPRRVLAGGAGFRPLRHRDVEAVEGGRSAREGGGGGEPPHGVDRRVAVQQVAFGHVEGVEVGVGPRDALTEARIRGLRVAVGMAAGGQIRAAEVVPPGPGTVECGGRGTGSVPAGGGPEDAGLSLAPAPGGSERVLVVVLLAGGHSAGGPVEEGQRVREGIAKGPGDPQGHVDPRPVEEGRRQNLEAGDAGAGMVPDRPHAHQGERVGHVLAAGAQGRRGPEVHDDAGGILALVLEVAPHHRLGRLGPQHGGRAGRQRPRVERGEVTPGGHHVDAPARGRARRPRRDEATVEGREKAGPLALRARDFGRRSAFARAAEDVQPVAKYGLAEVAEMRVEGCQRVGHGRVGGDAGACQEPGGLRVLQDRPRDQVGPARVEYAGSGIFLHEFAQPCGLGIEAAAFGPRRQVPEGHAPEPALEGRGLSRIVDDERVDHRQAAHRTGRPAHGREGDRLAGQPFRGAVGAELHQGVEVPAQAEVEGEIGVGRRLVGVVIAGLAVARPAAVGLEEEGGAAGRDRGAGIERGNTDRAEPESPARAERIGCRLAPAADQGIAGLIRQRGEPGVVIRQRHRKGGRPGRERPHQCGGLGERLRPVARLRKVGQDRAGAVRGVEADREAGPAAAGGIVRQDQGDPARGPRRAGEPQPAGGPVGQRRDAGGERHGTSLREARDLRRLGLERDREARKPPIEFRQGDLHGEVGRVHAACRGLPGVLPAAHGEGLQHRAVGRVEHEARILACRKGGCRDDQVRRAGRDHFLHGCDGLRVLQARHGHDQGAYAPFPQGRDQGRDRRAVPAEHRRPVDEHEGKRRIFRVSPVLKRQNRAPGPKGGGHVEGPAAGAPGEAAGQGGRGLGLDRPADLGGEPAQHPPEVVGAARSEIVVQHLHEVRGDGGEGAQARVGPVASRQDGELDAVGAGRRSGALDAVAPIVQAAEAADHDDLRCRDHPVYVEVHRHRVAQARELGETQGRTIRSAGRIGVRDPEQVGIGERQEDDVAGLLPEVDGRLALVQGDRVDADQVHPLRPPCRRARRLRRGADGPGRPRRRRSRPGAGSSRGPAGPRCGRGQ
ncbi:hypothetical protein MPOCJGCO_1901 [Methylobacterium trifolii]|uniref:Uncharacterized protein n=1 Tax=Methylobacterium trifolii TaxID=1003092 RepID=A0ABQ4TY20_9HYPH|nr:hypothetical protein MPOCJGCO_1901 [Methylobacterium trifolii]